MNHAAVLDALIPAGPDWPAFSAAVAVEAFRATLPPATSAHLDALAARIADVRPNDREGALRAAEAGAPDAFRALITAVNAAYYTAPAVSARVRDLANAGPREPSPHVDPTLVAGVLARARERSPS